MMQVVEISEAGGPDVLCLSARPVPEPKAGEVLIKVEAAGVNRPDVFQRMGLYPPPPGASDILGLEVSGTVAALGPNVSGTQVGDRVCALVSGGGYAEYCTAPFETILPIPEGLSFSDAAALPETFFTVWSNVFDRAKLRAGEHFLVHGGSSGIGSAAIQLAKAFGATVYTSVGSGEKATFCRGLGADVVINYKERDFGEVIKSLPEVKGMDVILDMVGGNYINRNIQVMAPDGRHVSIAFLQGSKVDVNMMPVMLKRLTLTGSTLRARDNAFKGAIAQALKEKVWPLLSLGSVKANVFKTFPLAEASQAHHLMESSDHMGKIVLTIE